MSGAVRIEGSPLRDDPGEYLEPAGLTIEARQVEGSPIRARLSWASVTAGPEVRIDHFLVRVSRR